MIGDELPFFVVGDVPTADADGSEVQELIEEIREAGVKPSLIVFDTLSRMLTGLDENSAKDASIAVKRVEEVKREFGCTVMVVHHTGKDGKAERGSSAFHGGFDTLIHAEAHDGQCHLHVKKQKDGERPDALTMQSFLVGNSLVLSPVVEKDIIHDEKEPDKHARVREIVKAALLSLEATNYGNGVETRVLATQYLEEAGEFFEDVVDQKNAVGRREKALNRAAKSSLSGYLMSEFGETPIWGFKAPE